MSLTDDALEQVGRLFKENAELRTELAAVRAELADHLATECADAAAGQNAERAEQAEAALAEMRERLGTPTVQRGLRYGKLDPLLIPDGQVAFYLDQGHVGLEERDVWYGQWRPVATWRTALGRAADEQGVQPVRDVAELTAPEHERASGEEWTAYAEALGIETGGEQGDGRDHTFEMLDDDAPKQNPRAVAEYWHEWADTCSNGGRDDEWTTVARVVGRILAAMDGEQGEREGGGDE